MGGGIEILGIKVPPMPWVPQVLVAVLGLVLIHDASSSVSTWSHIKATWARKRPTTWLVMASGVVAATVAVLFVIVRPGGPAEIAFNSVRAGSDDIYTMSADGTDVTQVTDSQARDVSPVWSPDGKAIAFASDRDDLGTLAIHVMRPDGSEVARITGPERGDDMPSRSPDGRSLVFQREEDADRRCLYTVRALPRAPVEPLPCEAGYSYSSPSWSSSGIAFVRREVGDGQVSEIWRMDGDGRGARMLISNGSSNGGPRWSPDGRQLLFVSYLHSDKTNLWTVGSNGTGYTQLTNDPMRWDFTPAWGEGGDVVVFEGSRDNPAVTDLYLLDLEEKEKTVTNLTEGQGSANSRPNSRP